jgi:hypothetical protein
LREDDKVARHGQRHGAAEVLFDERQRQVDAGGHPGRGPDRAVAHEDRIGLDPDRGEASGKLGADRPMGRRPSAVQHTGRSEQERAGADRGDAPGPRRTLAQPIDQLRVRGRRFHARAAGDHQRIQSRADARERIRCEFEPGRCCNALAAARHDSDGIGRRPARRDDMIVGRGEDLDWARDIEQLHRREGEHLDDADRIWRETRGHWHFRQSVRG